MWNLNDKRIVSAVAACGAALVLIVGCSDSDGTSPGGAGGAGGNSSAGKGGSASAGKGGNAAGGKAGATSGGAPSGGAPAGGAPAGGAPSGGAAAGGAPAGGAPSGGAPAGGAPAGGAPSGGAGMGGAAEAGSAGIIDAGAGGDLGAAGAPAFQPYSVTVVNGDFETGNGNQPASGWTSSGDATASYVGWDVAAAHGGHNRLAFYSASAYTVDTFQTISGLTNGTYEIAAWVIGKDSGVTAFSLYAKDYSSNVADVTKTDITPASAAYSKYSVLNVPVTSGEITLGFHAQAEAGAWINVDDVTLTRVQ